MNVLMVCSEFAPWAKTGGRADAVTGLSNAHVTRGHDVRVRLPSPDVPKRGWRRVGVFGS
jgi:glycogen synthase